MSLEPGGVGQGAECRTAGCFCVFPHLSYGRLSPCLLHRAASIEKNDQVLSSRGVTENTATQTATRCTRQPTDYAAPDDKVRDPPGGWP